MAADARKTAFSILLKVEKENAFSNLALDSALKAYDLNPMDKRLTAALVYGVIERKITLDYNLSLYLTQPIKKLKKDVLTALRVGAYQIFFSDKIPDSAAVNETVKLSKTFHFPYASGMINAVLRKCSQNGIVYPEKENSKEYISVKYSAPGELVSMLIDTYGRENTEAFLSDSLTPAQLIVRVNTIKTNAEELKASLIAEGVTSEYGPIDNSLIVNLNGKSISELKAFRNGLFHVQDIASQLCAKAIDAKPGETVFDMCSAPGGKSFTIAQYMNNNGQLKSFDIYPQRVRLIKGGAGHLGIKIIDAAANNAEIFNSDLGTADKVLCDVPCSGYGIIRRKPEIKYKKIEEANQLTEIQLKILKACSVYVKDGGRLIYSTCTLNPKENTEIVKAFLGSDSSFVPAPVFDDDRTEVTLMPHTDSSDGFFIAAFLKKENSNE